MNLCRCGREQAMATALKFQAHYPISSYGDHLVHRIRRLHITNKVEFYTKFKLSSLFDTSREIAQVLKEYISGA